MVCEQRRRRLVTHRFEQPEPDKQETERAPVETVSVSVEEADDSVVDPPDPFTERVRPVVHEWPARSLLRLRRRPLGTGTGDGRPAGRATTAGRAPIPTSSPAKRCPRRVVASAVRRPPVGTNARTCIGVLDNSPTTLLRPCGGTQDWRRQEANPTHRKPPDSDGPSRRPSTRRYPRDRDGESSARRSVSVALVRGTVVSPGSPFRDFSPLRARLRLRTLRRCAPEVLFEPRFCLPKPEPLLLFR